MRRGSFIIIVAALLLGTGAAVHAQQPPTGHVSGMVAGGDDTPLASASIELYAHADSSLTAGALSDAAGRFRIDGVMPGRYRLRVMYLGHQPHLQDVEVGAQAPKMDLGRIRLAVAAVALDAVEASAARSAVSVEVDRTVYQARQAAVAGGGATDVLRNVPGVDVDIDGNVSLRGTNVAIQVNGRTAPVQGDALANFLKQLPASAVDRVEVIANPSARYDPEGMGGIINIVLAQNTDLGLSGGVNLSAGTGDKYNGSGSLGYQAGRLTLFGTVGMNDDMRNTGTFVYRSLDVAGTRSYQQQDTEGALHNSGRMFNGTAELRLTEHGTLSSGITLNRLRGDIGLSNLYHYFDAAREPTDVRRQDSHLEQQVDLADAFVGFRRVVAPGANELSTELRYNHSDDTFVTLYGADVDALNPATSEGQQVTGVGGTLAVQTDAIRRVGGFKVELGQKFTFRDLEHGREQLRSTEAADGSTHDERVLAGYTLLGREVGRLSLQGGLRVEHTDTDLWFSEADVAEETVSHDYLSFFPSASAMYAIDDARTIRLSYARRIRRPNTDFLNPFPALEDLRNVMVGNPALRPEMTDAVELSLQQSGALGTVQVQPFLRRTRDAIRVTKTVDPDGVATTSFANLNTASSYGTDLTVSGRVGTRVNGMVSASAFRMVTDGVTELGALGSETFTWNARASLGLTVTPQLSAQMTLFHRAPMNVEHGRVRALTVTTFALQQKLLSDRASITLRISDPLDAMKMSFATADAMHEQTSWRKVESRIAHLAFAWSFGSQPRIRPRAQQEAATEVPIF